MHHKLKVGAFFWDLLLCGEVASLSIAKTSVGASWLNALQGLQHFYPMFQHCFFKSLFADMMHNYLYISKTTYTLNDSVQEMNK